ncbi:PilN domain-containing protein [Chiayiivirga flava]|uniref:General secretion pathway protein L n=1 Tax=Chiayiivirga flava TaxID=659595 RepID=A0A7W8D8F3_9GAMM|nr:PilN domain-containing protein [Chiayiivirga flava]MBB5208697.1 general secretion pathway protein L [Chiayiivirga flava]
MPAFDFLSQPLSRLRARYVQSPVPRFLRWWGGELRACLPERWRQQFVVEESVLLLRRDGDSVLLERQRGTRVAELGRFDLVPADALPAAIDGALADNDRNLRRILLLPGQIVLRRLLTLPAAVQENLRTVLGFELDRQTPFKPEQVNFDSRVLPHDPAAKQIPVELALVTRERMQAALTEIDGLAGTLSGVDAVDTSGRRMGFNFLPADQRIGRRNTWLLIMFGLAAASVLFLLIALARITDNRAAAVERLTAEVEAQREEARKVTRLRDELESAASGANFLAIEKERQPSTLLLLDELTRLLPDDTFLERLSVSRGELSINGQSGQAPKLVELLQASKLLRSPSLSGPIQPDARSGKDRFNITARYGPDPDATEGAE